MTTKTSFERISALLKFCCVGFWVMMVATCVVTVFDEEFANTTTQVGQLVLFMIGIAVILVFMVHPLADSKKGASLKQQMFLFLSIVLWLLCLLAARTDGLLIRTVLELASVGYWWKVIEVNFTALMIVLCVNTTLFLFSALSWKKIIALHEATRGVVDDATRNGAR